MGDIGIDDDRSRRPRRRGRGPPYLVQGSQGRWSFTAERQALHDKIIMDALAGKTAVEDPVFNVLGGGPTAGKSTMVDSDFGEKLRDDPNTVMVNADDLKAKLPEYQAGDRQRGTPRRPASSTRRVSIWRRGRRRPRSSSASRDSGRHRGQRAVQAAPQTRAASAAGYRVEGHYVTVPTDIAVERANARGRENGPLRARERWCAAPTPGSAQPSRRCLGDFDAVDLFDTRGEHHEPGDAVARRVAAPSTIENLWDEFVAKGRA